MHSNALSNQAKRSKSLVMFLTSFIFREKFVSFDKLAKMLLEMQSSPTVNAAVVRSLTSIKYHNQVADSSNRLNFCKETLLTVPVVIYTRKNFFLIDAMNEQFENFKAAGLLTKWFKEDIYHDVTDEIVADVPKVFSLHDLLGCFQVWVFGMTASFVIFVVEMFYKPK